MFSICHSKPGANGKHANRRELLRIGTLGFGSVSLAQMMATSAQAAGRQKYLRDKSVVMLNLQGGPTQFETFDPKMEAPQEIRSMFGEVRTSLPGVCFGSHFPELARRADRLAVVRSYRHGMSSHEPAAWHVAAGGNTTGACMGSLYAHVAGITNASTGIPNHSLVIPAAIKSEYRSFNAVPSRVTQLGTLPAAYKAFDPSSGGQVIDNMKLNIGSTRLDDRRGLLSALDDFRRTLDGSEIVAGAETFQRQAFDVILGGVSEAFDLAKEERALVERYDTRMFDVRPESVAKRARKDLIKGHSPVALGLQMLMARRLVEAGCGFVTVTCAGWDMHGDHEFEIADGMPVLGPAVDKAVSAFMDDVEQRGLTEKILLVIAGEFGRTPKINKVLGRDHWGDLCPLVFAGGGLPMGQVIGQSDRQGGQPVSDPISSQNVMATIFHTLLDIGQLRLASGLPTETVRAITADQPIAQLVS